MTEFWDDYEHIDSSIEYILESVIQASDDSDEFKQLKRDFEVLLQHPWQCQYDCQDLSMPCFKYCDNYSMDTRCGETVLTKDTDLVYECNSNCGCNPAVCLNRLVQRGPRRGLSIEEYPGKGLGLKTDVWLPKGAFICEYAGEILTKREAGRRNESKAGHESSNYLMCLNERSASEAGDKTQTFIDPTVKGNIGRYLNHSCDPNCKTVSVRTESPIPRVGIFASRDIGAEEELCFHYGGQGQPGPQSGRKTPKQCLCAAKTCAKYLPSLDYS